MKRTTTYAYNSANNRISKAVATTGSATVTTTTAAG